MIKIFKIIEKVVWTLVAIAVIMTLALIAIDIANSADNIWDDFRPYILLLYGVAMLVVAYKVAILGVLMYLETKIEEKKKHLQTIIEKQQIEQERKVFGKLDKMINDIAAIPNIDTAAIADFLKVNLPNIVSNLVDQKVSYEIQKLALEYEDSGAELKRKSLTVDDDLADGLIKQSETFDDDQLDFIRDIFGNLITDTKNGYLKDKAKGVVHPLQEEELAIINVCQKQLGADEFESVEQFYRNKSNTWNEIIEEEDDNQD